MNRDTKSLDIDEVCKILGDRLSLDFYAILNLLIFKREDVDEEYRFRRVEELSYAEFISPFEYKVLHTFNKFLSDDEIFLDFTLRSRGHFGYRVEDELIDFIYHVFIYIERCHNGTSHEALSTYIFDSEPELEEWR